MTLTADTTPTRSGWIAQIVGVEPGHGFGRRWVGKRVAPPEEWSLGEDHFRTVLDDPDPGLYEVCDLGQRYYWLVRTTGAEPLTKRQAGQVAWALDDGVDISTVIVDTHGRPILEIRPDRLAKVVNPDGSIGWSYVSRASAEACAASMGTQLKLI